MKSKYLMKRNDWPLVYSDYGQAGAIPLQQFCKHSHEYRPYFLVYHDMRGCPYSSAWRKGIVCGVEIRVKDLKFKETNWEKGMKTIQSTSTYILKVWLNTEKRILRPRTLESAKWVWDQKGSGKRERVRLSGTRIAPPSKSATMTSIWKGCITSLIN